MNERFVGSAEAAAILGVELQRIARYRKEGKMPPPVARLGLSDLWRREDVELLAKNGEWRVSESRAGKVRELDLMGVGEAAVELGVSKSQVSRWRRKGTFPAPDFEVTAGPVWKGATIRAFKRSRERAPA